MAWRISYYEFQPYYYYETTEIIFSLLGIRAENLPLLLILDLIIPDPNWFRFRSRGVDPTFLIMYEHKGGVNPLTFLPKMSGN